MTYSIERYSISETKKNYTAINKRVQEGREIITYDGLRRSGQEVSHIKTEMLDRLLATLKFHPEWTYDEELACWTVFLPETNVYGEGPDRASAIDDLIKGCNEYAEVYLANIQWFSQRPETGDHYFYLRRILKLSEDRDCLCSVLEMEA